MKHIYEYFAKLFSLVVLMVLVISTFTDAEAQNRIQVANYQTRYAVGEKALLYLDNQDFSLGEVQWQKSTDQKLWLNIDHEKALRLETYPLDQTTWFRVKISHQGQINYSDPLRLEVIGNPKDKPARPKKDDTPQTMTPGPCPNPSGGTLTATAQPPAICAGGTTQLDALARIPFRLIDDFDATPNTGIWAQIIGGSVNNSCTPSPVGSQTLWFNGPSNQSRGAETVPLNTTLGNYINFYLKHGGADIPGCEPSDLPNERIILEYSNDGITWTQIDIYDYNGRFQNWGQECVEIPPGARTTSTRFRFRQRDNSGMGNDNWALDKACFDTEVDPSAINYTWSGGPVSNPNISNPTANPTTTTTYTVTASYGNVTLTATVTVTVNQPPTGGSVSGGGTACAGSCTRQLTLSGHNGSVQSWQVDPNCTGNWATVPGNGTTLSPCVNVTSCYRAVVSTPGCPPAFSGSAQITVPPIGQVTTNQNICRGQPLQNLNLTGTNCSVVRWERSDDRDCGTNPGGVTWVTIANTTTTQNPGALQDTACFRAVVSCNGCPPAATPAAIINVDEPPTPGNITGQFTQVCAGDPGPLIRLRNYNRTIVRWEMSNPCNVGPWVTLNPPYEEEIGTPAHGSPTTVCYRAIVRNGLCPEQPSQPFTIQVVNCPNPPPIPILLQDTIVCFNGSFELRVINLGSWQIGRWEVSSDNGVTWSGIRHTSTTYTATNVTSRRCYRVLVTTNQNPLSQRYTNVACVRSTSPITGGIMQGSTIACSGSNQGCMTLTGHTQPPAGAILRWETRRWDPSIPGWENGGVWTTVANTSTQLCYQNLTRATEYRAVITDGGCSTAVSFPARVDIDEVSVGGHVEESNTICINTSTVLRLTGQVGDVESWQVQPNCTGNFTDIQGSIFMTTYITPNLNTPMCYRVRVKSGVCPASLSDVARIDVTPLPNRGHLTQNATICRGGSSGTLTLTGHTGPITRWERALNIGGPWVAITNTQSTLTENNLQNPTYYRVVVGSGACQVFSDTVFISVDPPTVLGNLVLDGGDCIGTQAQLRLTESTGTPLRWEYSENCTGTWTTVAQTTVTFSHTLNTVTCFRVFIRSGICPGDYSDILTVTPQPPSIGGTIAPQNATVCSGQSAGTLTLSGHVGTILRWERSSNCPGFSNPAGLVGTTTTINAGVLTQTTCFRAVVKNGQCPEVTSAIITINVSPPTVPGTVTTNQTLCPGVNGNNLTLTGQTGSVIRWESSTSCTNFSAPIATITTTTTTLSVQGLTTTTCFRAVVQSGTCNPANSNHVTITLSQTPTPGSVTPSQTICGNQPVGQLTLAGHTGTVIRWESSTDCPNFGTLTTLNQVNTTFTPPLPNTTTCYRAVVRNPAGCTANSQPATIVVSAASVPGTLGAAQTVCNGQTVQTLNLTGNVGNPIRWEQSQGCTGTWTSIDHTLTNYSPGAITTNTCYRVVVSNQGCPPQNSNSIQITVTQNVQPGAVNGGNTICPGENSAQLTLSGHQGTVVRWESSTDCPNFVNGITPIVNTLTTYTANGLTTTTCFRAVVQSGNCGQINSQPTTVTVLQTTPGAVGPTQILCQVSNSGTLTLTGNNGTVVRWESSPDCATFTPLTTISNQTVTHNFNGLTVSTCFRAIIRNGNCPPQPSDFALVSLDAPSVAGTIGGNTAVCSGDDAGTLRLTGFNLNITGWQSSTNCPGFGTFTDIPNQTPNLAVGSITQTTCFRAMVQNGVCPAETTQVFTITVDQPPVTGQVSSTTVCRNGTATLTLTGHTGTITGWQAATTCGDFNNATPINNVTATLTIPNATQNACFRAMVRNGACAPQPSQSGTITIDTPPVAGRVGENVTVCSASNSPQLTASGINGNIVEWQSSTECTNFTNPQTIIHTGTTYTPPPLTVRTCFRVKVRSGSCPDAFSNFATISVDEPTIAGTLSPDRTICSGNTSGTMTLAGNRGTVVRWERSTDCAGNSFGNPQTIAHIQNTYQENSILQTTCFRAVVKNGECPEDNSNKVTITVDPGTSAGTVVQNQSICYNTVPQPLTLENFIGTIVEWQSSTECAGFTNPTTIPNTTANYTPTALTQTTCYRAIVQSGNCLPAPSAPATITVAPEAVGGTVGIAQTVCTGTSPAQLNLSGQTGNIVRWESATTCTPFTPIATILSTTNFIIPDPITQATCYRAIVQSGVNCPEVPSAPVTIDVEQRSVGGSVTANQTLCVQNNGANFTLSGETGDIVRWEFSTDCANFSSPVNLQNAGNHTLNVPVVFQAGCYRAIVQNGVCPLDPSTPAQVTLQDLPVAGTLGADQTICVGNPVQALRLTGYTGTLTWTSAPDQTFTNPTPINNTSDSFTPQNLTQRTCYRVTISNPICPSVNSNVVCINVDNQTLAGTIALSATVCQESNNGTLTLSGHQGNVLRWESATNCTDPLNPVGLTTISNQSATQTYTNLQQTTCYRAWVQSGSCQPASTPFVTITVVPTTIAGTLAADNTVCFGTSSGVLTLTGKTGDVVRWERATNAAFTENFATINNQTTSFEEVSSTVTRYYRVIVKNGICPEKISNAVVITVLPSPNAGRVIDNQTICTGTVGAELRLVDTQNATILRWESSSFNFQQGQAVNTHTNTTDRFEPGIRTSNMCYRAVVAAGQGCTEIFSQPACITVDAETVAGTLSASQTLCSSNANGTLTLTGHIGTITAWESATQVDFSNSVAIQNSAGQTSINFASLTTTTYYRARVKSGVCPERITNTVTIQVDQDVIQPNAGSNQTICTDNVTLTASAIAPAVAIGQWTVVSGTGTFGNATNPTTTVTNVGFGVNEYQWTVRNGVCPPKSDNVIITRDRQPTVANAGNNETICQTQTTYTLRGNTPTVGTGVWTKTGAGTGNIFNPNSPTTDVTGLSIGDNEFTYTITNGNVCTPSVSRVVITVNANTLAGNLNQDATVCYGNNNGTIQLSGHRGTVLRWESVEVVGNGTVTTINNTNTSLTYTNLTRSTRYRVVVQNIPCLPQTSNEVTITVDPATVGGQVNQSATVCRDGNQGVLQLSGHVGNIVRWEQSLNANFSPKTDIQRTTNTITYQNLTQTTYYRAIVKSGVCGELPSTHAVIDVRQPSVSLQTNNIRCFGETNGWINVSVTGGLPFDVGEPFRYNWTKNGVAFSTTKDIANLGGGQYCVTVTDAIGCIATACSTITQPSLLVAQLAEATNLSCFEANDGRISIQVSGGTNTPAYLYRWTRNNIDFAISQNLTGLTVGTYAVTVTDGNGCITAIGPFTLTQPNPIISVTSYIRAVSCYGLSNGSIGHHVSGGTPPYTYIWNNGAVTEDVEKLRAGTYTITVTDAIGCRLVKSFTITEPYPLEIRNVGIQNVKCFGGNTGAIGIDIMGGTRPYFVLWSNNANTEDLANIPAGVYDIYVRDANGCVITQSFTVGQPEPMTANFSIIRPISCGASATGAVRVSVSGGNAPYTYLWNNGATTDSIVNVPAGGYSVSVKDKNNCVQTFTYTLAEPNPITIIDEQIQNVICKGTATGGIAIRVQGGDAHYTYQWSNGTTVEDPTGLTTGSYTLTITDGKGCTFSKTFFIREPEQALTVHLNKLFPVTCSGKGVAGIDVSVTGGWYPYTFKWSNGVTTEDLNNIPAGDYVLEVTDTLGCKVQFNQTITNPEPLRAELTFAKNPTCAGKTDGAIAHQISGGLQPYTYQWSSGHRSEDIENLPEGTYTLTITDALGCTLVTTQKLTAPQAINITTVSIKPANCAESPDGSIFVQVTGGQTPYQYAWSNNSINQNLQNVVGGNYTLTVKDANNCTATKTFNIPAPQALTLQLLMKRNISCNSGKDGMLSVTQLGGTPPYTLTWRKGSQNIGTGYSISGLNVGTYTVEVKDKNGCTTSLTETLTEPKALSVTETLTQPKCFSGNNGAITLQVTDGTAPYTYKWNTGATIQNLTSVHAGIYSVTVTDSKGCFVSKTMQLTQPNALQVSLLSKTNVDCKGKRTGSISLNVSGGTGNLTYQWSTGQTTKDISNLGFGSYSVTVTDANSCTARLTGVLITEPTTALSVNLSYKKNSACKGTPTGEIGIDVKGGTPPYQFAWSNGANTEDLNKLSGGTYTLTVTDNNNCTLTLQESISEPNAELTINLDVLGHVVCNGGNDGKILVNVTGGTQPYTYAWTNGSTNEDVRNLEAGVYTLVVRDKNNCLKIASYEITQALPVLIQADEITSATCKGGGSIRVSVSGGQEPYQYLWSDGSMNRDLTNAKGGTYQLLVTDGLGCKTIQNFTVPSTEPLSGNIQIVKKPTCYDSNNGLLDLTVRGGEKPYTFLWSNGLTTEDNPQAQAGANSVVITDQAGCVLQVTTNIAQVAPLFADAGVVNMPRCNGMSNGLIGMNVSGGEPPYRFIWSNGAVTEDLVNVPAGIYTLTATDSRGCSVTFEQELFNPDAVSLTEAVIVNPTCFSKNDGSIVVSATGGTAPYTYRWSNGVTQNTLNNIVAGTYTLTATDKNGCSISRTFKLSQPDAIRITVGTIVPANCNGGTNGRADVNITGGTGNYAFTWSNAATTEDLVGVPAGIYTLTVRDENNCSASTTLTIPNASTFKPQISASQTKVCVNGANVALTATPSGGRFSGIGITGSTFNPVVAGVGKHTITYSGVASGCNYIGTISIDVLPLPNEAQIRFAGKAIGDNNFCRSDARDYLLTPTPVQSNINTTFTGNGVRKNGTAFVFRPSDAGAGTHIIKMTLTDRTTGCSRTVETTITVGTPPVLTASAGSNSICTGASTTISVIGAERYTWSPATGLNTITGSSVEASPTTTTTYTVTGISAGCSTSTTVRIQVTPAQPITLAQTPGGIHCTGTPIEITANSAGNYTYVWNPQVETANTSGSKVMVMPQTTTTYTVTGTTPSGCTRTTSIQVTVQSPGFTLAVSEKELCKGGLATINVLSNEPNGLYTITPNIGVISTNNGQFTVSPQQTTTYTITRSGSGSGNACNSQVVTIRIRDGVNAQILNLEDSYCVSSPAIILQGQPAGGTFKINGASVQALIPRELGVSTHGSGAFIVTYEGITESCSYMVSKTITITEETTAQLLGLKPLHCSIGAKDIITAIPSGGILSGPGINGNVFDPSQAGIGIHAIRYSGTAPNGCTFDLTQIVEVKSTDVQVTLPSSVCVNGTAVQLSAIPIGGTFTGRGVVGNMFIPSVAGFGTHMITYAGTDAPCTYSKTVSIMVTDAPNGTSAVVNASCPTCTDGRITVNATGGLPPYSFSVNNLPPQQSNVFDNIPVGVHHIFVSDANGCSVNISTNVISSVQNCASINELSVIDRTKNTVTVAWNSIFGAVGYTISWRKVGFNEPFRSTNVTQNQFRIVNLEADTEYEIRVRVRCANGVSEFQTIRVRTTAVREESINSSKPTISVYPNPNKGSFSITLSQRWDRPLTLQIMDLNGKLISTVEALSETNTYDIQLPNIVSGVYLMRLPVETGILPVKLHIE